MDHHRGMFDDPSEDYWRKFTEFIKKPRLIPTWGLLCSLVFMLLGAGLVVAGLLKIPLVVKAAEQDLDLENIQRKPSFDELKSSLSNDQLPGLIKVDLSGSVLNPGVYQLESDSRLTDAISAAGGLDPAADAIYISQELNLSSILSDEQKIYLPSIAEREAMVDCQELLASSNEQTQETDNKEITTLVSINSATSQQLENLPGIGEKRAQDIISNRPYSKTTELLDKKIIGENTYQSIADLISL